MQAQLRILNDRGIALYRDYLDELRGGSERKPPRDLLADPWCTARFPLDVSVERRAFQNKLAVAGYLNDVLRLMPHSQIERQVGEGVARELHVPDVNRIEAAAEQTEHRRDHRIRPSRAA